MSLLRVGNVYGHGFDPDQRAALASSGFAFRSEVSRYAGSQVCTFIDFPDGPSLELIEVTDHDDYESFVPSGMEPYCPGISLVVDDASPIALGDFERKFPELEPYRLHVPYSDAAHPGGADPETPGWRYLNFGRPVIAGAFVWLTAFDQPRPAPARRTAHPNGVRGVRALVFESSAGLDCLARVAGEHVAEGRLQLGGVEVLAGDVRAPRRFPLRAVVLQADDLDTFARQTRSAEATRLLGRTAVRIETNPLAWDLWVTA